jgi:hypothetical protein
LAWQKLLVGKSERTAMWDARAARIMARIVMHAIIDRRGGCMDFGSQNHLSKKKGHCNPTM